MSTVSNDEVMADGADLNWIYRKYDRNVRNYITSNDNHD